MRHLKSGRKLSRRKEHRKAMLTNLAASLIIHGSIRTTDAKAKEVRPFVERLVTFARRGDLHARRIVSSRLRDPLAVKKLFEEIGPQFIKRFGGYTRIVKLGFRHGDNSSMYIIQFVGDDKGADKKKQTLKKTKKAVIKPVKDTEQQIEETPETDIESPVDDSEALESKSAAEDEDEVKDDLIEETSEKPEEKSIDPISGENDRESAVSEDTDSTEEKSEDDK